jgi:PPOX class probable F420-dependent enzyme
VTDADKPPGAHVEERLRTDQIAWLGTVRPDGRPHLVPVWFFWDGESVLVFTKPEWQKVRNLRQNPRATLALDDTKHGGDVVIVEAEAELLAQPSAEVVPPAYVEKYAAGIAGLGMTEESMTAEWPQAIRLRPTRFLSW